MPPNGVVDEQSDESDEFVPTLTDVYELVGSLVEKIDEVQRKNQWLGEHLIPTVAGVDRKFSEVLEKVDGFIATVASARIPGLSSRLTKAVKDDG